MQEFFREADDDTDPDGASGRFVPTDATVGPWSAQAQHGGPPSALLVRAAERCARASTGRDDLVSRRFAAEFLGPVPVAPLETTARVLRTGRSAVLVEATLAAGGRACLQARVWLVGRAPSPETASDGPVAAPADAAEAFGGWTFPYAQHLEWRFLTGSPYEPGPATVWVRPAIPLIGGEALSGLQRAVLVADSVSGVSAALSWSNWSFPNVDLDLHLAREVRGDWLLLDGRTDVGPDGTAVARSVLADVDGPLGGSLQTLVVRPARQT